MTDRINGFIVVLDKDYREDDVQAITDAIKMIKGVKIVEPHISTHQDDMSAMRAVMEIKNKIFHFLNNL